MSTDQAVGLLIAHHWHVFQPTIDVRGQPMPTPKSVIYAVIDPAASQP